MAFLFRSSAAIYRSTDYTCNQYNPLGFVGNLPGPLTCPGLAYPTLARLRELTEKSLASKGYKIIAVVTMAPSIG